MVFEVLCWNGGIAIMEDKMKQKVVVLRELQRAIMYTSTLIKQAIKGHVSTVFVKQNSLG